nr:unnamed protein product [Naegleria fowleri]
MDEHQDNDLSHNEEKEMNSSAHHDNDSIPSNPPPTFTTTTTINPITTTTNTTTTTTTTITTTTNTITTNIMNTNTTHNTTPANINTTNTTTASSIHSFEEMAQRATQSIMDKYEQLLLLEQQEDDSYQNYYAHQLPPWKSRFIASRIDEFPSTREELEHELKTLKIGMEEKELEGEQSNEFAKYLFEEFLDEMDPWINYELQSIATPPPTQNKKQLTTRTTLNPLRIHYILNDIENDRKRIIRQAIESFR